MCFNKCVRNRMQTGRIKLEAAAHAPLQIQNASQLRDLAASAVRIFGWDSDKPGVQLNQQFVLTQEQIDRIREAAEQ